MPSPRVSILMPIRDAEGTLEEALASLRAQTLGAWELLAVDDGSEDRTARILRRWAAADPRVRVVSRPRVGLVAALEAGRLEAEAPFLARMDADDRAHPERLEAQLQLLDRSPGVVLAGTHVRYFPRNVLRGGARRYEAWLNSLTSPEDVDRNLWVECPLAHPTFLARAEAVASVGGYRDRGWPEDYDLLLRLRASGGAIGVVPRVLLEWREGPRRHSRIHPRYRPEAFRRLKVHFLLRTLLRGREGLLIWGAGPVGKAFARTAAEAGIPLRAFVELDPRKVGHEIHGAPVVPPGAVEDFRGALGVAAVGRPGAREEIRQAFRSAGWEEGRDFVAVA